MIQLIWTLKNVASQTDFALGHEKITRRTIGAKGFNFLQERLDKKGLKGTTSLYLSITIYSLSSIIYCYYLSLSFNMCFKKLSFWWNFHPLPVNDNLATVSIEGQHGNTPIFQWKRHHFPPFVKTSAKRIKFCKPSLTSWFNIKDHRSHILFILSFLLCNSIACNWLSCDLQFMAAYRWLFCLLYYERNLQPSDWLIGKVLIPYWPEGTINLLILKKSFSRTRTVTLKTCKNNYTI